MTSHKKPFLVKQTIVHDNYDIFVVSESWLTSKFLAISFSGRTEIRINLGAGSLSTLETHLNRSSITCQQLWMLIPNNSGLKSSAGNKNLFYYALLTGQT